MAVRRRKLRSGTVLLGGMGVLAATLTACGSEPDRRCVDPKTHKVLPDYKCDDDGNGTGRYYYGGRVSTGKVTDGSFDKSAVDRGGFGSGSGSGGG